MANFSIQGVDELIEAMSLEARRVERNGSAAVEAGAQVALEAMKQTVPVRTGGLKDHIKIDGPHHSAIDGYHCDVYPTGTKKNGKKRERYETVGYVLEYGRSNMAARPWMRPAVENNSDAIGAAIADTLMRD